MKQRTILLVTGVTVFSGLGLATLSANPGQPKNSTYTNHDSGVLTIKKSDQNTPNTQENATPTSSTSPETTPTPVAGGSPTVPQSQPPATLEEELPPPVTVQTATKRIVTNGLHKDYYCDLVYSDSSTRTIKVGESQDTDWGRMNLTIHCDQYIGTVKS